MRPQQTLDPGPDLTTHDEATCQRAFAAAGWRCTDGRPVQWPLRESRAVALLQAAGYDIDEAGLADLAERGYFAVPEDGLYTAQLMIHLSYTLDARRQWVVGSTHDPKLPPSMLAVMQARAEGLAAVRAAHAEYTSDGARHDARSLLLLLTETDNRPLREAFLSYLLLTLEVEHGIRL